MNSRMYAVIQDDHAGLIEISTEIVATAEQAVELADRANRNAAAAGVPVNHRAFVLRELDETEMWDWGLQAPGERVMEYVNERAARNSQYGNSALVRRRLGTEQWYEVSTGE